MGSKFSTFRKAKPSQQKNTIKQNWFSQIDESKAPNIKQYLRGVRNYYILAQEIKEYDMRKKPNMLIPKFIYKIRREHYIFWEISRVARGLPKTFTYSNWDPKSQMMYHVDLEGKMVFEKLNFKEERIDLLENPLLGPLIRRKPQLLEDEVMVRRANRLAIYYLNIHKRYDLDNYLTYKPISLMDWVRAFYYLFMTKTGIADTYRNEQFLAKPDFFYNFERNMIALNFNNPDKSKVARNIIVALNYQIKDIIQYIENEDD